MRLFFLYLSCLFTVIAVSAQTGPQITPQTTEQTPSFKEENFDRVVRKLGDRTSLTLLATGTLTTFALQPHDADYRGRWVGHQQMHRSVSNVGDILGSGYVGAAIIGMQYLWDDERENWKSHARSLVWQTAVTGLLKYSTGVQRPGNKNRYESFPSGHTATAFATATSLTYSYGAKAAAVAYPLAVLVGLSRMADDMHWASDVVAGGFVGFIMARASASDETVKKDGPGSVWIPAISPAQTSVTYLYSF